MKKRHLATMTAMVLAGALLAGCSSGTAATEAAKAPQSSQAGTEKGTEDTAASDTQDGSGASEINRKLFFCPKSVGFDYWTSAEKGIMEAAKTLGYDAVFNGPATTDSAIGGVVFGVLLFLIAAYFIKQKKWLIIAENSHPISIILDWSDNSSRIKNASTANLYIVSKHCTEFL